MNIGQVCSRDVVVVSPSEPLATVAKLMQERHVGCVVVTKRPADRPVPVGIVTDRDIVRGQLERAADLFCLNVEQVMSREPLVLLESEPLESAVERLRARGVRRAPVVSANGELVGLVSIDDLLPVIAGELSSIARLIDLQPRREHRPPS